MSGNRARATRRGVCWSVLMLCLGLPSGLAQEAPVEADTPLHTLHIYTDLMQMPVLVLNQDHEGIKPLAASRFLVRLDGGPIFHVTKARREGDDPLSIAVLIDGRGREGDLVPVLPGALAAALGQGALLPGDRVSLYALDCQLTQTMDAGPPDAAVLESRATLALQRTADRLSSGAKPSPCGGGIDLWSSMRLAIRDLWQQKDRRRVLLVFSEGNEPGGQPNAWKGIQDLAQITSTAVIGMRPEVPPQSFGALTLATAAGHFPSRTMQEDKLDLICQMSGGVTLQARKKQAQLSDDLVKVVRMIRDRYILEFPRARNGTGGLHGVEVEVSQRDDLYIRETGIAVPMPDAAERAAREQQEQNPGEAPVQGTRRALAGPR